MKIRKDFVTNSSSSSFVIATRDNIIQQDYRDFLIINDKEIRKCAKELEIDPEEIEDDLYDFISMEKSLHLDGWDVSGTRISNEGSPAEVFLYDYEVKNTDKIKMAFGY